MQLIAGRTLGMPARITLTTYIKGYGLCSARRNVALCHRNTISEHADSSVHTEASKFPPI